MSAPITLYWSAGSCARVPLVALEEIGVEFDVVVVDREQRHEPAYLAINPKGKVPSLFVDDHTLTENPAIETYLARAFPEARLLPSGDRWVELDALSTMSWFAAGVHPAITRLRAPHYFSDDAAAHAGIQEVARAQLEEAFAILEARLTDRDFLYGEWSIVDAYMLWLWFRACGSGMDGAPFPRCAAHALRVEARPSVARALDREERELERIESERGPQAPYTAGRAPRLG